MRSAAFVPGLLARPIGRLLAVLGVAFVVIGVTTLPASAHDAQLSASAKCDGTVSYTATSWAKALKGENKLVYVEVLKGTTWDRTASGAFEPSDYAFSGTTKQPTASFPLRMRVYAAGTWGDGVNNGYTSDPITVSLPTNCGTQPPPVNHPKASVSVDCSGYHATLNNKDSQGEVVFTVTATGTSPNRTEKVTAGQSKDITGNVQSTGTTTVTVSAGGKQIASGDNASGHCGTQPPATPKATVSVDCKTGYSIDVSNPGSTGTTVTVNRPGVAPLDVVLGAGDTKHYAGTAETGTYSVTQPGTTLASQDFDQSKCASTQPPVVAPKASISVNCTTGFTTVLDNTASTGATTYVVTTNAGTASATPHDVTVPGGASQSPTWPVKDGVAQTVTVAAPGLAAPVSDAFGGDCSQVSAPPSSTPTTGTTGSTGSGTGTTSTTGSTTSSGSPQVSAPTTSSASSSSLPKTGSSVTQPVLWTGVGLVLLGAATILLGRLRLKAKRS